MNFLSPLNLLWALPIGGLIVVMYILKLRRKDMVVSSTYLWRQVIRDVQANAPFQKLRKNLLLLLQLIIAALIIVALARPLWRTYAIGGRNIVLVVDTSASMRATDVSPSRLDAAKREADDLVNGMQPGDMMMVLSASSRPEAATGFTNERAELHRAIAGLEPHDTPTNMRDALNLAADLVASRNNGENGRIELISDGGFETREGDAGGGSPQYTLANLNLGKTHIAFHPIGKDHDNVGIVAVDFRRNLGTEKTVQLLVVTHNYSTQAKRFNEEIYARDDQGQENLVEAHEVNLAPGAESTEPYDIPEPDSPRQMRVHLDLTDELAADNTAVLILKPRKTLKVLLVGPENLFLEDALRVDPGVELGKSAAYPGEKQAKAFDVVVFYNAAPAKLPEGNYLFLHCVSDQAPVRVNGSEQNVAPADWEKEHPALRYVDFGSNRFQEALRAQPLGWGHEIAVAESGSLIVAGEKNKMRALFVGFDLDHSRFPLTVAFPIFISNSVRWLGTGGDDSERSQVHTSDPITIPAPSDAGKLTITRPDGSKREVAVDERGGATFAEADLIGLYTATGKNFSYPFAANLSSASESDITPHRSLTILANPTPASGHRVVDNRDLIPLIAFIALVILCIEWWAFHRRVYVS
jgi:hypothetical protein